MVGDLAGFAREQATAARLAGGGGGGGAAIGEWKGIGADGQGVVMVGGREVRGIVMAGRAIPVGAKCLVMATDQGAVIRI